jgi:lactate dehydrogenase-like 2-hydroxyacid dehydrogenase
VEEPNKTLYDYEGNVMITNEYAWFTDESVNNRMNIRTKNIIEARE